MEWTSVVEPADTRILAPTPQESLTLVTCYPFHLVGAAPKRFVVRAAATADPVSRPANRAG